MDNTLKFIRHHRRERRRGVILMIVLGVMIMFSLLALTFMVVTSQSWRMSDSHQKYEMLVDYRSRSVGEADAWSALLEIARGSNRTSIGVHSIFENLYGHPVTGNTDLLEFEVVSYITSNGMFYIGRGDGSDTPAEELSNAQRLILAPEAAIDSAGDTNLNKQLIGICLRPRNGYSVSDVYDLMGNVLMVSQPRIQRNGENNTDYQFYRTQVQKLQQKPARIVKKILERDINGNEYIFVAVYPPEEIELNTLFSGGTGTSAVLGTLCIVNGAPYSGTGIGFNENQDPWLPRLAWTDNDINSDIGVNIALPLVLRPNMMAPNFNVYGNRHDGYKMHVEGNHVRMNVDYTAPDYNSMFLSWSNLRPDGNDWKPYRKIIPSFLRPALMYYLVEHHPRWNSTTNVLTAEQRKDMMRKMVLRPLPFDHPNFTGSNKYWDFGGSAEDWKNANIYVQDPNKSGNQAVDGTLDTERDRNLGERSGPLFELARLCAGLKRDGSYCGSGESVFDVDNDGDGIKEGIWIDAGLPVRMSADGQLYKPLISVTVLDMDGRVNVNVHGNTAQLPAGSQYGTPPWGPGDLGGFRNGNIVVPRGTGSGPAGVRLAYALASICSNSYNNSYGETAAAQLMYGLNLANSFPLLGRYGFDTNTSPRPGDDTGAIDRLANLFFRYFPLEGNLLDITETVGPDNDRRVRVPAFGGTPPDLWDVFPIASDPLGHQILFPEMVNQGTWQNVLQNNPYIFDTYNMAPVYIANNTISQVSDTKFTPAELADLLRATDVDYNSLPKRLQQLLLGGVNTNDLYGVNEGEILAREGAKFLTTISNDIPLPNRRMGRDAGIYSLLYRCVEDQMIRQGIRDNRINLNNYNSPSGIYVQLTPRQYLRACLHREVSSIVERMIKVLPEEIRNGEKLDLNKLTQRPSWNAAPFIVAGTAGFSDHVLGLQEKSDYARGIYLLLMAMSYDQLYGVDDFNFANNTVSELATPYFEPALAQEERLDWRSDNDANKKELCRQVMATRLAQYAVNLVDYADSDATMTPLIFDIDPFTVSFMGNAPTIPTDLRTYTDIATTGWIEVSAFSDINFVSGNAYKGERLLGFSNTFWPYYIARQVSPENIRGLLLETNTIRGTTLSMSRARMIFGMERSDLLLTETLATHDLGVADTSRDDVERDEGRATGVGESDTSDPHFDQVKMPQASAWFELYCTANPTQPTQPRDIFQFDASEGMWRLNLGQEAPTFSAFGTPRLYPVWQLAISESTNPFDAASSPGKKENNIALRLADSERQPITFSLQTQQPEFENWTDVHNGSILGPTDDTDMTADVEIDRIVWFGRNNPYKTTNNQMDPTHTYPNWNRIFWGRGSGNDNHDLPGGTNAEPHHLYPNEYLIVAPRMTTYLGSHTSTSQGGDYGIPSGEGIDLKQFPLSANNQINPLFYGTRIPRVIVAAAQAPDSWGEEGVAADTERLRRIANLGVGTVNNDNAWQLGIGVNISAPMPHNSSGTGQYYPRPGTSPSGSGHSTTFTPPGNSSGYSVSSPSNNYQEYYNGRDFYKIYSRGDNGATGDTNEYEITSTIYRNTTLDRETFPDEPYDLRSGRPIAEDCLYGTGTIPMYRSVMLQRLSDPNLPYHPLLNPYLTVDWSMMDLSVFTGEDEQYDSSGTPKEQFQNSELSEYRLSQVDEISVTGINSAETGTEISSATEPNDKDVRFRLASRQWGRTGMPFALRDQQVHPNPWSRALDASWIVKDSSGGGSGDKEQIIDSRILDPSLLGTGNITDFKLWTSVSHLNVQHRPQHSLGRVNWMYVTNGTEINNDMVLDISGSETDHIIPTPVYRNESLGRITIPNRLYNNNSDRKWYFGAPAIFFDRYWNENLQKWHLPWIDMLFANHEWRNSPYANPYEVMSVPASAPGRFGIEFVDTPANNQMELLFDSGLNIEFVLRNSITLNDGSGSNNATFIVGSLGSGSRFGFPTIGFADDHFNGYRKAGMGHVLNFHHSSTNFIGNDAMNVPRNFSMNLGGFLDHIQVPSKFRGTKLWLEPNDNNLNISPYGISTYQEPGRINLNTLQEPTWQGISNDRTLPDTNTNGSFFALFASRLSGVPSNASYSTSSPLDFAYPFRSQSMNTFVPEINYTIDNTGYNNALPLRSLSDIGSTRHMITSPADATLLRRTGGRSDMTYQALMTPQSLGYTTRINEYAQQAATFKKSYTEELEGLQRLSSMTTTRSNVFAVWVTVGYFEAEPVDFDTEEDVSIGRTRAKLEQIYPDGYKFGEEVGYSTGDVVRHRSFYLIDRSIPVGFRRGENKNVDDAVILKTAIE